MYVLLGTCKLQSVIEYHFRIKEKGDEVSEEFCGLFDSSLHNVCMKLMI